MEWLPILLFSGLCTSLSFCVKYRQHCLVETPKTWHDAQSYCRERGSDLVTVDNTGAMRNLLPLIASQPGYVWIGLAALPAIKTWKWILSDNDFYKMGERDYRNFQGGIGSVVYYDMGRWMMDKGYKELFSVCYDGNKQGRDRYVLVTQKMSFNAAVSYCREHHTDLVSIRNETENQFLRDVAGQYLVWIGLFVDNFLWSDMRYSSFRFWVKIEKMLYNILPASCVGALSSDSGRWTPQSCEEEHPFICACNRTMVLKVKVHSEDLHDLNDPSTKAALLERTQQLIEDATLPNGHSTMWKTQPDGQVFTKEQSHEDKKTKVSPRIEE